MKIKVLAKTPNPQQIAWLAMHCCYTEKAIVNESAPATEQEAGQLLVKHLLAGHRGHYSPLESNSITFACSGFPHSVIVQARTHRIGCSFSVQSMRYSGDRIVRFVEGKSELSLEDLFYFRQIGSYRDRNGKQYEYTFLNRVMDVSIAWKSALAYAERIHAGFAPEHARDVLVQSFVQDFVCTFNARSLMHVLDLRAKADAQLEIRQWAEMLFTEFKQWMPETAEWYESNRLGKARLSP